MLRMIIYFFHWRSSSSKSNPKLRFSIKLHDEWYVVHHAGHSRLLVCLKAQIRQEEGRRATAERDAKEAARLANAEQQNRLPLERERMKSGKDSLWIAWG